MADKNGFYRDKLWEEVFDRFDRLDTKFDGAISHLSKRQDALERSQSNLIGRITTWAGIATVVVGAVVNWIFKRIE